MNLEKAIKILDINERQINEIVIIRKKYKMLALKYHPDKNPDHKNYFLEIKDAFDFLIELNNLGEEESKYKEPDTLNEYQILLIDFLTNYASPLFAKVLLPFLTTGDTSLLGKIERDDILEIYEFLMKYKHTLHISSETLQCLRDFIKTIEKDDVIVYLNPSLQDLLEANCFKLWEQDNYYIVPLWHKEVHFDLKNANGKLIVICDPEFMNNVSLDDDNNIVIEHAVLLENRLLKEDTIQIPIGSKNIFIPVNQVRLVEHQMIQLNEIGIPLVNENNIYDASSRGEVYVKLILM